LNVAIIDADLIGRKSQRFPNLACMKLSAYHKQLRDNIVLKLDYDDLQQFDKVYISKVFLDTEYPSEVLELPNVEYSGTGFFYDKAKPLPYEIEHIKPDYQLYSEWVNDKLNKGTKPKELQYYTDFSIGFTTRGCIRQCSFCVNKNYKQASLHSPIEEFLDKDRKYICLLDDNMFACKDWKSILAELHNTKKRFQFKQGLDERLLTDEKCEMLFKSKWIGDYIFAFDNIKDKAIIEDKLKLIRKHTNVVPKFYVFCGYNHNDPDNYNDEFWKQDIVELFERIKVLTSHSCLPYIMRYKDYELSPYRGMYINITRWCNQPSFFKKKSFREFCIANGEKSATMRYSKEFEDKFPEMAEEYYDIRFKELNKKEKI